MKRRIVLATASIITLAAATLGLTGCSSSSNSADGCTNLSSGSGSDSVSVTGDFGGKSTATFTSPLTVSSAQKTIAIKGDGQVGTSGQTVDTILTIYSGADGSLLGSLSYPFTIGSDLYPEDMMAGVACTPAGTRSVIVAPASDIYGSSQLSSLGLSAEDSLVMVIDVVDVKTDPTVGEWTSNVPTVTWNGTTPTITLSGNTAPSDIEVAVLKKGDGATVTASDTVSVSYMGVKWSDGTVFDENYSTEPTDLALPNVVSGFRVALVGQTVGSQLLVTIPAADAYGASTSSSSSQLAGQDLVFLIDIVGISS